MLFSGERGGSHWDYVNIGDEKIDTTFNDNVVFSYTGPIPDLKEFFPEDASTDEVLEEVDAESKPTGVVEMSGKKRTLTDHQSSESKSETPNPRGQKPRKRRLTVRVISDDEEE